MRRNPERLLARLLIGLCIIFVLMIGGFVFFWFAGVSPYGDRPSTSAGQPAHSFRSSRAVANEAPSPVTQALSEKTMERTAHYLTGLNPLETKQAVKAELFPPVPPGAPNGNTPWDWTHSSSSAGATGDAVDQLTYASNVFGQTGFAPAPLGSPRPWPSYSMPSSGIFGPATLFPPPTASSMPPLGLWGDDDDDDDDGGFSPQETGGDGSDGSGPDGVDPTNPGGDNPLPDDLPTAHTPEPATGLLLTSALIAATAWRRRRRSGR